MNLIAARAGAYWLEGTFYAQKKVFLSKKRHFSPLQAQRLAGNRKKSLFCISLICLLALRTLR